LIPRYGFSGAAIATVITAFLTLVILIYLVKRFTPLKLINWFFLKHLLIIILATTLMAFGLIIGAKYNLNPILKVFLGGLIYVILLVSFLLLSKEKITINSFKN